MSDFDRVNVDLDPALIPIQAAQAEPPGLDVTAPGATFVGSLNAQGGVVTLAGGISGFTFPSGSGIITLTGPLTTKGDIYVSTGAAGTRQAVGANNARLVGDSAQATGLNYIAASTGWGAPSGTLSRAAYAAYAGQTVSNPPTQVEMQALDDAVKLLSQTVAALLTDLRTQKLLNT